MLVPSLGHRHSKQNRLRYARFIHLLNQRPETIGPLQEIKTMQMAIDNPILTSRFRDGGNLVGANRLMINRHDIFATNT